MSVKLTIKKGTRISVNGELDVVLTADAHCEASSYRDNAHAAEFVRFAGLTGCVEFAEEPIEKIEEPVKKASIKVKAANTPAKVNQADKAKSSAVVVNAAEEQKKKSKKG